MLIDKSLYNKIISLYPKWKELNLEIKKIYSRGINLHEAFSEIVVAYHYKLDLCIEKNSNSADARDLNNNYYQIKGASSKNDLSSFGPKSIFDVLIFCYIDQIEDQMSIYFIENSILDKIYVNKKEKFSEQQQQKRRPRFSIYKKIIQKYDIKPEKIIDLKECIN